MNKLQQPPEAKSTENAAATHSKKRRAFIKGSAAALPVVLTLRNGSAFAMTSVSCLEKQASLTPTTIIPATDVEAGRGDSFKRTKTNVRIIVNTLDSNDRLTVYQFPKDSGNWFKDTVNSTSTEFYTPASDLNCDSDSNTTIPDGQLMTKNNSPSCPQYQITEQYEGYILLQLSPSTGKPDPSNPVVGPKDTNQTVTVVATNSCATSLNQLK